ncbi:MAG: right-handed parallel beta-helix repeat-containing protein, partial [Thermoplasmatales archaeon]|nr:right-handed parallel beta-helix repeat-containing protein [Thermoplasmatales archaeon]
MKRKYIICGLVLFGLVMGIVANPVNAQSIETIEVGGLFATNANAIATCEKFNSGEGSWKVNGSTAPGKFETYIYWYDGAGGLPDVTHNLGVFTIDDIQSISYYTNKPLPTDGSNPHNFYLVIYTLPDGSDDYGWYGYALHAEPYFSENLSAPADTWVKWSTDDGANKLTFCDHWKSGTYGFYGEPTLQRIQEGIINWGQNYSHGFDQDIDYGLETVKAISFQTASGWYQLFDGYIDTITITLKNGTSLTIDLENKVWIDDDYNSSTFGYGYDHFNTIQQGINAVGEGGKVIVHDGTYKENIVINKEISLVGDPVIDAQGGIGISIEANNTLVENFTIYNGTTGIRVYNSSFTVQDVIINNCTIYNFTDNGISFENVINSWVNNTQVNSSSRGIYLYSSSHNNITDCIVHHNTGNGIYINHTSSNNTITNCSAYNNSVGIHVKWSHDNKIINCTVYNSSGHGIFLEDTSLNTNVINCESHHNVDSGIAIAYAPTNVINCSFYNNRLGINLWHGSGNNITNCSAYENTQAGIALTTSSSSNNITNCSAYNNYYGIWLDSSSNNNITNCIVYENTQHGIYLYSSHYVNLIGCEVYENIAGIYLNVSHLANVTSCDVHNNNEKGIVLESSNYSNISYCNFSANQQWDLYVFSSTENEFYFNQFSSYPTNASILSYSGDFSVKGVESPPDDPSGWENIGKYLNVSLISGSPWVNLSIYYEDETNEDKFEMLKYNENSGEWERDEWYESKGIDTTNNYVWANITSFSIFAPMQDITPPTTTKEIGEPKYDEWLTSQTPIWLNATDEGSGVNITLYRIYCDTGDGARWHPNSYSDAYCGNENITAIDGVYWYIYYAWNVSFGPIYFHEECEHIIEYASIDNFGNEEEIHNQTHYVDNTPPTITKEFEGPTYNNHITSDTTIWVNSTDDDAGLCPVGSVHLHVEVYNASGETPVKILDEWHNVTSGTATISFNIPEECEHWINITSIDDLGNTAYHNQTVYVDNTPPTITKEFEEIIIFEEYFEGAFPPAGWTVIENADAGGRWRRNDEWGRPNYAGGYGYCADADSDAFGPDKTMDTELRTPQISLVGYDSATLKFMAAYRHFGNDYADVDISINGGASWINLLHWVTSHSPCELVTIDLTPYIGNNVIIRWHYGNAYWGLWYEIDNVTVTGMVKQWITSDTIIYVNSTDDGLCPVGSVHLHVEVYNATTGQKIYDEWSNITGDRIEINEGFETSVPPPGWTEVDVYGTQGDWDQISVGQHPSGVSPHSGNYMARFNSWSASAGCSTRLYTPQIDFTSSPNVALSFWMYHDTGLPGSPDRVVIQYSLDGTSWNDIATFNRYDGSTGWKQHTVDLSSYVGGQNAYIGFLGVSDYGNDIHLDDIEIVGGDIVATISFTIDEECEHWINITSIDDLGNTAYHNQTVYVDNTPPVADVDEIIPYCQIVNETYPISINATANDFPDCAVGIASITLYYRFSRYNSTFGDWISLGTLNSEPWQWSFTAPDGSGYYQFYTVAYDFLGHHEPLP